MGGSAAGTPGAPEYLRASDAERDHAVSALRQEFAAGRLSHETFMVRMNSALDARDHGQLNGLFADLPPRPATLLGRLRSAVGRWAASGRGPADPGSRGPGPGPVAAAAAGPAAVLPPPPLVFPPGHGTSFTIGRTHDCDLRIADLSVSRLHAQLDRTEDGWLLSDLGSHNGTRVNGWRVREPVPVRPGDMVQFGSAAFVIHGPAGPGWPPAG
jgi:hypothetical protein